MAMDYEIVGTRLKNARVSKELTQNELSKILGISVAYLSRVENGKSKINLTRLTEISEKLNIPLSYFLEGSVEKAESYLEEDFERLLKKCSPEKQKMIFEIAKTISKF